MEKNIFINICQGSIDFISFKNIFLSCIFPGTKYSQYVFRNYSLCNVYLIHKNNNDEKTLLFDLLKKCSVILQLLR